MMNQNKFIDVAREKLHVKSDAALAHALDMLPPAISRIRSGNRAIGSVILVRLSELTDLSIREIRSWADTVPSVA